MKNNNPHKCLNCGETLGGKKIKYCNHKCRMAHKRRKEELPSKSKLKKMTADDLYDAISTYPRDTWKDSIEFKELIKRIKVKPVSSLEKEGYFVPNWKK